VGNDSALMAKVIFQKLIDEFILFCLVKITIMSDLKNFRRFKKDLFWDAVSGANSIAL
jgi:hypothetical protein